MKVWIVATYKINELKRLQENLQNQDSEYYHPKIKTINQNLLVKEELLFPGYILINTSLENYTKLKYNRVVCFF
tara:strand:+ start:62 stop:283 length:222 start_codon:yes stop_codon:yes gene_type:complete